MRTASAARTSTEDPTQALKLERRQVGEQGQFASLLQRKRAEKMVTWDTEPPKRSSYSHTQHSQSYGTQA